MFMQFISFYLCIDKGQPYHGYHQPKQRDYAKLVTVLSLIQNMHFHFYFMEILTGFTMDFHWCFIEISTDIHCNDNWISIVIS